MAWTWNCAAIFRQQRSGLRASQTRTPATEAGIAGNTGSGGSHLRCSFVLCLDSFIRHGRQCELYGLRAEPWVFCGESYGAGLLFGANPDGARSANERLRIVANELRRSGEREYDGVVGVGTDSIELIGHTQYNAGCIRTVGLEGVIIRQQGEFSIGSRP